MPRKPNKKYDEIIAKYVSGNYSITTLAKQYKMSKSSLSEYFSKNDIKISEHAKEAVSSLNRGFENLSNFVSDFKTEHNRTNVNKRVINPCLVVDEVVEIVKERNPAFARVLQNISAKILKRTDEILENTPLKNLKASDLNSLSRTIKDVNDTLQVIPKPPAIQQQINVAQNQENNQQKQENNILNINVEFE